MASSTLSSVTKRTLALGLDEMFFVVISVPTGPGVIGQRGADGTILNDD